MFFAGVWDLQSPPGTWDPMIFRVGRFSRIPLFEYNVFERNYGPGNSAIVTFLGWWVSENVTRTQRLNRDLQLIRWSFQVTVIESPGLDCWTWGGEFCSHSLVFQIPCEDQCLDPQTPPEKAFRYLEDFGRLGIFRKKSWRLQRLIFSAKLLFRFQGGMDRPGFSSPFSKFWV